jgi:putative peptide zinc metalloprotease protein
MLTDDPEPATLLERLGAPVASDLVEDLLEFGFLADGCPEGVRAVARARVPRRVEFSRSGILFAGIARPARLLDERLLPVVLSLPGRVLLGAVVTGGVLALVAGRPQVAAVSSTPAFEVFAGVLLGLGLSVCHEFGHAVALLHFGREPRRAGFGFYWGSLSFYVDSTPALTLPRPQRVVQALAGLMVDLIATALLAVAAQCVSVAFWQIVLWRAAVLGSVAIAINLLPILEVDGHWALADLLDEPDLAPRARRALGELLRGGRRPPYWLAVYGAVSLVGGFALIGVGLLAFWSNAGELVQALFHGDLAEALVGCFYVLPLAAGTLFSVGGLILESVVRAEGERASAG